MQQHVRPRVHNVGYTDGFITFSHTEELVQKPEWTTSDRDRLYAVELEGTPQVAALISELRKLAPMHEDLSLTVRKASRRMMEIMYEQGLSDHLHRCIRYFADEIAGEPIPWALKVGFSGVVPETETTVGNTTIWLTRGADLERMYPVHSLATFRAHSFVCPCGAYLSTEVFAPTRAGPYWAAQRLVGLLSVFGLGEVYMNTSEWVPSSLLEDAIYSDLQLSGMPTKRYRLTAIDTPLLARLFELYLASFAEFERPGETSPGRAPQLAFTKYKRAIQVRCPPAQSIADAIASLEASLLEASERSSIGRKLRNRVSALLCHFGFVETEIRVRLVQAYTIRSEHVHGAGISTPPAELETLRWTTVNYARYVLLILAQLTIPKSEILRLLDCTDRGTDRELGEHLNNVETCWKPA